LVIGLIEGNFVNYTYQQLKDNGKDGGELQDGDIFLVSRGTQTLVVNVPVNRINEAIQAVSDIEQSKQDMRQLGSTMETLLEEFTDQTKSVNQLTSMLQNTAAQYRASNQLITKAILEITNLKEDIVKINDNIADIRLQLGEASTLKLRLDGLQNEYSVLSRVINQTSGMLQSTSAESKKASQNVTDLAGLIAQVQQKQDSFAGIVNIINQMGGLLTNAAPSI
jgi:chromosome segregation ATPase